MTSTSSRYPRLRRRPADVLGLLGAVDGGHGAEPEAGGLDSSLRSLADIALGTVLLLVVALGLVLYGVYSFARARYARL